MTPEQLMQIYACYIGAQVEHDNELWTLKGIDCNRAILYNTNGVKLPSFTDCTLLLNDIEGMSDEQKAEYDMLLIEDVLSESPSSLVVDWLRLHRYPTTYLGINLIDQGIAKIIKK